MNSGGVGVHGGIVDLLARVQPHGLALVSTMGRLTIATGLLLLVALGLDRALERRVSAGTRVLLYLPVALRLLLPASLTSPLGLIGRTAARVGHVAFGSPLVTAGAVPVAGPRPGWGTLALFLYVAGVALLIVRMARVRWRTAREAADARPASPEIAALATDISVLEHPHLGPLVMGVRQPRILLPQALVQASDLETLGFVLRHERAHVDRGDHLLALGLQAVCALAWPLVPVWLAATRVRALMELACDERALASRPADARRRYGEVLLAFSEGILPGTALASLPSFASALRGRIRALGWRRRWPRIVQFGLVVTGGALALACAVPADRDATPAPSPGETATSVASATANHPRALPFPLATQTADEGRPESAGSAIVRGALDKQVIRDGIRAHIEEVKTCYETALAQEPPLGGRVVVRFTIGVAGSIDATEIDRDGTSLKSPAVESCLLATVRTWTFPPPHGGGVVVVSYPFNFTPSEKGAASTPAQRAPGSTPSGGHAGWLDTKVVGQTVGSHMAEVKRCFEMGFAADPKLFGRTLLHLVIDVDGAVAAAEVTEPILANVETGACLTSAARGWQFPPPTGGSAEISFPFVFQGSKSI